MRTFTITAVDEYRKYRDEHRIGSPLERRADAAIAELEAEAEERKKLLAELWQSHETYIDQAIARVTELEARLLRYEDGLGAKNHFLIRAEQAEAELAQERKAHAHDQERADHHFAELAVAINVATMARQTFDENGNGVRPLSEIEAEVRKDVRRVAGRGTT